MKPSVWGAVLGCLGVGLGAFGAHALKGWLLTVDGGADRLAWWQTGVQYHLVHALFLIAIATLPASSTQRAAAWLAVVGIALFSGSLYTMTLTGVRALGAVTPLGGVCFLGAWAAVAWAAAKAQR